MIILPFTKNVKNSNIFDIPQIFGPEIAPSNSMELDIPDFNQHHFLFESQVKTLQSSVWWQRCWHSCAEFFSSSCPLFIDMPG